MKKTLVAIAVMTLSVTALGAGIAGALGNSATAPLIMNSSGYAVFASTTTNPATSCTGMDGQTYSSTHGTGSQYGNLTDGNQLTAKVYGGVNRPNDAEPSTTNAPGLDMTTSNTSGYQNKPGFQIKAQFTFNQSTGRGTGKGTVTIYPVSGGKINPGGHPKYRATGPATFVLQVLNQVGTVVSFEGRAFFNATVSRWVKNTNNPSLSAYKTTGHAMITNAEFAGTSDLAPGGSNTIYAHWGSTFDSLAVLGGATTPSPEFIGGGGGLPMDDVSVLTTVPGKTCP